MKILFWLALISAYLAPCSYSKQFFICEKVGNECIISPDQDFSHYSLTSPFSNEEEDDKYPPGSFMFYMSILISIGNSSLISGLTCTAGLMSGLTVGLLSIDRLDLELKMRTGNVKEKVNG